MSERLKDHNLDAEQSVIGALLVSPAAWDMVADVVTADDFFRIEHRIIFRALAQMAADGRPMDVTLLLEQLGSDLEAAGGLRYIGEIAAAAFSAANADHYARIVRRYGEQRRLQMAYVLAQKDLEEPDLTPAQRAEAAAARLTAAVDDHAGATKPELAKPVLARVLDRIDTLFQSDKPSGTHTGFGDLDFHTNGLQDGDLIIVAARPSMGKTTFAMNVVAHIVGQLRLPGLVFSMEMSSDQLMQRALSAAGKLPLGRVLSGKLLDEDWPRLALGMEQIAGWPLYVDDSPTLTPADIRVRARRTARAAGGKLGVIMVDYLQLMRVPGQEGNRTNEISEISRALKALAKEMGCPVIALSQLNRGLEGRASKRPVMSDLRESGAIEQDADVILFLYRDSVYHPETAHRDIAELIMAKQRNGQANLSIPLREELFISRFVGISPHDPLPHDWNAEPSPKSGRRKS